MSNLIDETGNVYDCLTVLARADNDSQGKAQWLCQCSCGEKSIVRGVYLRKEHTKSCGCARLGSRLIDEIGNVYGRLTVIGRADNASTPSTPVGFVRWHCRCECGKITVVHASALRSGASQSCGCYLMDKISLPKGEAALNKLMCVYKRRARKRGLEWRLSKQEFTQLTSQACYYCGIEPSTIWDTPETNGTYTYNGIDRVDNSKGYIPDNCVSCCMYCNKAKLDRSVPEFLAWVERIHTHGQRSV